MKSKFELTRDELLSEKENDYNFYNKLMKYEVPDVKISKTITGRMEKGENTSNTPKESNALNPVEYSKYFQDRLDEQLKEKPNTDKKCLLTKGQDVLPLVEHGNSFISCLEGDWRVDITFKNDNGGKTTQRISCYWDVDCYRASEDVYEEKEFGRGGIVPEGSLCPQQMADEIWDSMQTPVKCESANGVVSFGEADNPKAWLKSLENVTITMYIFSEVFDTLEEGKDVKVRVTARQNEKLQEALFANGYTWAGGNTNFRFPEAFALHIEVRGKSFTCFTCDSDIDYSQVQVVEVKL